MGLTFLISGHPSKAVSHFEEAKKLFDKTCSFLDSKRMKLFMALSENKSSGILERVEDFPQGSFELGLYHYVIAQCTFTSKLSDHLETKNLHEAERIFRKVPSLYWLGQTLRLKAQYALQKGHLEKAQMNLQSAYNIFSRLGAKKEIFKLNRVYMDIKDHTDLLNRMA